MIKVLLLGDSLVAEHDWQSRMPSYKVYRYGYPGEVASGLLRSLSGIKQRVKSADIVMVMVGTNDLLTGNHDFIETLKEISVRINTNYPDAEILFCSLQPMYIPHLPENSITDINNRIKLMTVQTGCCYLDTHQRFLESEKQIFQIDGVHLTDAAYEIWTRTLLEHIAFLIEDD
ncbi:MAG: SGNH/GDSL hydrolase family protein [Desulforhopalus sp.]